MKQTEDNLRTVVPRTKRGRCARCVPRMLYVVPTELGSTFLAYLLPICRPYGAGSVTSLQQRSPTNKTWQVCPVCTTDVICRSYGTRFYLPVIFSTYMRPQLGWEASLLADEEVLRFKELSIEHLRMLF